MQVAVGHHHACALMRDQTVRCWGGNAYGQLGDGTTTDRDEPVTVLGLTGAVALAAGDKHTCARTAAGAMFCWGSNADGQLGDLTTVGRTQAVAVALPTR